MKGPLTALGIGLCATLIAGGALAQSGAIKSGIRGRVVISSELRDAKLWKVDDEDPWYQTEANVRRRAGRGSLGPIYEANPEVLVVLEGAKQKQAATRAISIEGMRFSPASVLIPRPARLKVNNRHDQTLTVVNDGDDELATIEAGRSALIDLEAGSYELGLKELPFARARVRVLDEATVLPVAADGLIDSIPVEGGDYKLAFYHGAEPLQVQEVAIPDQEYIAVDASISANRVVTVSVKDGGLKVIRNQSPPPAPKSPPKSKPKPEKKPEKKKTPAPAGEDEDSP